MKLAKLQAAKSTIRFSAKLVRPEAIEKSSSWTLLNLPKNTSAKLPSRGMTMVEGTIMATLFELLSNPTAKEVTASRLPSLARCRRRRRRRHGNGGNYAGRRRTGTQGASGPAQSPCNSPARTGVVGGNHTHGALRLDSLAKLSQATGNTQEPDRESLRHACIWKTAGLLFWRFKLADERLRNNS